MESLGTDSPAAIAAGLVSIWVLGVSVSLTACTATCLPFMGALVVGGGENAQGAVRQTAAFAMGKIVAYAMLGGFAGWVGNALLMVVQGPLGHWLIGGVSLAAGISLITDHKKGRRCNRVSSLNNAPPFALGFALSFVPCAPLAALLAAAALGEDPLHGAAMGTVFGLGTALTPLFVLLPLLGHLGREMVAEHPGLLTRVRWVGGGLLLALGLRKLLLVW